MMCSRNHGGKKGNLLKMKLKGAYWHFRAFQVDISKKKVSGNFPDYEEG